MKNIQLGIGPIGWANDDLRGWGPERRGEDIMQEIAQAGYEGSEMSYTYPPAAADVRDALGRHGLVLASAYRWTNFGHADLIPTEMTAARRHVDFCADAGARYVLLAEGSNSLHWDVKGPRDHVQPFAQHEWERLCEAYNQIGEYAMGRGLQLAVHPHGGTAIESAEQIARFLQGTDAVRVGYCLDTGHAAYAGESPMALVEQWGQRIKYVHLKDVRPPVLDNVRSGGKTFFEAIKADVFGTPGEGNIPFEPILRSLFQHGYEGWLVVEADQDPNAHPALEVATAAHARLRAWLDALK